jgi:protein gp37
MAGKKFNRTTENVDWAWWTWNPVTGCKHGCPYCYAREIAMRFTGHFNPDFHPDRLEAPKNTPLPRNADSPQARSVFVCSMSDLFGAWVPQEWIDAILREVANAPDWTFLFLTKNPSRLATVSWPENAWVGTTVDRQARVGPAERAFRDIKATVRFVSLEPILEEVTFTEPGLFDWWILGGKSVTGRKPVQPEPAWVDSLLRQARAGGGLVYCKPNLTIQDGGPKEYPSPPGARDRICQGRQLDLWGDLQATGRPPGTAG